jgi:hypothetical protein
MVRVAAGLSTSVMAQAYDGLRGAALDMFEWRDMLECNEL